eukprot:270384-Rhodomonas_salina.1
MMQGASVFLELEENGPGDMAWPRDHSLGPNHHDSSFYHTILCANSGPPQIWKTSSVIHTSAHPVARVRVADGTKLEPRPPRRRLLPSPQTVQRNGWMETPICISRRVGINPGMWVLQKLRFSGFAVHRTVTVTKVTDGAKAGLRLRLRQSGVVPA